MQELQRGRHPRVPRDPLLQRGRVGLRPLLLGTQRVLLLYRPRLWPPVKVHVVRRGLCGDVGRRG